MILIFRRLTRWMLLASAGLLCAQPGQAQVGTNYALNAPSYMVRLTDTLPPAAYANDGNLATTMETTDKTVDGYWETDLGQERALSTIRVIGIDNQVERARLAHATVRLFDAKHQSVFSKHLDGLSTTFDVIPLWPVRARYVRVGFENKERSHASGGIEWWLKIREVEAYGRPVDQVGILGFAATPPQLTGGQSTVLQWQIDGVQDLRLHPGIGAVMAQTAGNGIGQITLSPTATTEYVLVGTTPTETYVRQLTVQVDGLPLPPRISEVVAANALSLRDGFNDAPDWIEVRNPNGTAIDLAGYCLSDDPSSPASRAKWTFPAGTILPAYGQLVVCASGNALAGPDADGYLHAGFKLSDGGEHVVLSSAGGVEVVDAINYPALDTDLSYGRGMDGTWTFLEPTPGELNLATAYSGWLQPLVFSQSRGIRSAAFTLSLTNPNPSSQTHYSLNGDEPALVYGGPLNISTTTSVRARPFRTGFRAPRTQTHSYVFPAAVPTQAGMTTSYATGTYLTRQLQGLQDLPTVCLSVPDLPDDYIETEGSAEFFLPGNPTPIQINCGMERFGGAWTEFAKKSYKLGFSAAYGARKLEAPLFNGFDQGVAVKEVFDSLELRACNHDMVERGFYMGGRFIEDSTLAMGSLNPHGRFVHVMVNGTYWGMYDMRERMVDAFLAEYLGGAKEDYVVVRGNDNVGSTTFIPGTPEPPNRELWESVRANRSSYMTIKDKVDVPHLIDFMLIWFYGNNENEFRCAGPVVAGSGFKFWLADSDGYLYSPNVSSALTVDRTANAGPGSIFGSLVSEGHPDFKTLLADRIQKHLFNGGALTPERNLARLNARMTEVYNAMVSECARWGYRTPENWASAADTIRTGLFPQRTTNLFNQLRARGLFPSIDAPVLSQHGGAVDEGHALSFAAAGGTIYYTLDGSDPRLPGGGISPTAVGIAATTETLVPMGSTWKFWDMGSLPAANWQSSGYADASWSSGPAQLGYGDGGEATVVSYGPSSTNKFPTTYFRKSFTVTNPAQISQLSLGLIRDDGAVVYLNGVEVARSNMPTGTVLYSTWASTGIGGTDESAIQTMTLPVNQLVAGTNVLAVEVHQNQAASSDLSFDLMLTATRSAGAVTVPITANTTVKARVLNGSTWSALTEAAFQVSYPLVANGPYVLGAWDATAPAGSYPDNMVFYQTPTATPDPALDKEMAAPWILPYNRTSKSRINGLGANGFAFINTSDPQDEVGSGYVGAAVLALNTTGAQDIKVTWTGGTVLRNARDYGIRLQYRVGGSAAFTDVTDSSGNPVEYLAESNGHARVIGPTTLPAAANNQPLVQLRWKYYFRSGNNGARPQLRVDDIQVSVGHPAAARLEIAASPATGQSGRTLGPLVVRAKSATGALATGFTGMIQAGLFTQSGVLAGSLGKQAVAGEAVFDDLVISQAGEHTFVATAAGLAAAEADVPTRVVALGESLMPVFVQGIAGTNDQRVPVACRLALTGLRPNALYRFANRAVRATDSPTDDGAGNMIFVSQAGGGFTRSLMGPGFAPADHLSGHGEFTTDATGAHNGWFVLEPTGNDRFTTGGNVFVRLILNDGENGVVPFHHLTAAGAVRVLSFGTAADQGTAVFGDSAAAAKNFAVLYDDPAGTARPLAVSVIESSGAAVDASYADFYESEVAGRAGRWGAIVPNGLAHGVRRIEERDGVTGAILSVFLCPDGMRPTSGLANGSSPVGVRVPAVDASPFARWQSTHFSLAELAPGGIGGPQGSPVNDGVPNLIKFATGTLPFSRDRSGLPVCHRDPSGIAFQYRRPTGSHGLAYQIEISSNLHGWGDADADLDPVTSLTLDPGGRTETIIRHLPVAPGEPTRFLRLRVTNP